MQRRDALKTGLALAGGGLLASRGKAQDNFLKYLCPPDGTPPDLLARPSPPSRPFAGPLNIPPVKSPVPKLYPDADPTAHQGWAKPLSNGKTYPPQKFYTIYEQEFKWIYHPDPPYDGGTWGWGFDGITPGPTYHARYGEPILVRRFNNLPPISRSKVTFALPSTSSHLHNAHTASESDGSPQDWIDPGEFWDHHYCCFPSGDEEGEKLTTLWYHDHRLDFTAANVYAGLAGFFLLFDDQDSGNENDTRAGAWRLPSDKYDVPLLLHDVLFDQNGQVVFDPFNTDGILGDKYTVNRKIQPFLQVERRKYRFRILNGGPSRFYHLFLKNKNKDIDFVVLTGDGNFQQEPLLAKSIYLAVAQRNDVIIDFSQFDAGEQVYLQNRLLQTNGKGPTERMMDPPPNESVMRFDVIGDKVNDPSQIPDRFRPLPRVNLGLVRRRRTWVFDYNGGLWTVNGQVFDPNRIDATIERGTAEIWTLRNQGKNWSHPIHSHFTEFMLQEVNGVPLLPVPEPTAPAAAQAPPADTDVIETSRQDQHRTYAAVTPNQNWRQRPPIGTFVGGRRRDIATLNPSDELVVYMKWDDFLGKYIMHCHNVVHEDHAMMIRWDIVEKVDQKKELEEEQKSNTDRITSGEVLPHLEERPTAARDVADQQKAKKNQE
jgi:FtsP/CotA-like multicopper oxidase with cupredoxin domain